MKSPASSSASARTRRTSRSGWIETFGEYGTDDETEPYYSILLGTNDNGSVGKCFHILYEERRALVRTLDLHAVSDVLVGQFEHVAAAERDDAVFVARRPCAWVMSWQSCRP